MIGKPANTACLVLLMMLAFSYLPAQRTYRSHSVFSEGNWFKIAVKEAGIYKIDLALFASLGVNSGSISSSAIRVFGNGGQMLPEACNGPTRDDLVENPVWIEDGGDGQLNAGDYILFYAAGPHEWKKDSLNRRFTHIKNLYTEKSWYFIQVGGSSARIPTDNSVRIPNTSIDRFDDRYFYELDTVNFLSSGKEWAGEEFSSIPGQVLSRNFSVPMNFSANDPLILVARCVARSIGTGSSFSVRINSQPVGQLNIPAVANGAFDLFARAATVSFPVAATAGSLSVGFDYTPGSFNSQGWLDWFEVHARRDLSITGTNQLFFRDWNSTGPGNIGSFSIKNASAQTRVWDVTDPLLPVNMQGSFSSGIFLFVNDCASLHEYIAFEPANAKIPEPAGRVPNQDLHGMGVTDFLIVTHESLLSQAERLAIHHRQVDGLRTEVVTTAQVFNEFSSGTPDPVAVRDFIKMFYDRAGGDSTRRPRYILLFGDASFDYKDRIQNNTNLVPSWESAESWDPLSTYTSDDFFGFLGDNDDINAATPSLLDAGIGRIPAGSAQDAASIVDKIIAYRDPSSFGPWRNEFTFVADDEDANLHFQDAEVVANEGMNKAPQFNFDKIYLDAYHQQSTPAGSRYPEVNLAIQNQMNNGNLIWNYSGHGGARRLAEEVILDQDIINGFSNQGKLPLFITATCDFAPYDNPLIASIGENLLLRPKTGAIALMTTTRLVFAFSNRVMNTNYLRFALQKNADSSWPSLGDAVRRAKNYTYTFFGDVINNRKFTLLGDPALTLGFPLLSLRIDSINGRAAGPVPDTLKALSSYEIKGAITDAAGNLLPSFQGTVFLSLFDKNQIQNTLGNDPDSYPVPFKVQKNLLFRGKATVDNSRFVFRFIVPKDIDYAFGNGKMSLYASNNQRDAGAGFSNVIIGGTGTGVQDQEGPRIRAYLNDEKFVNGGISNERPLLLLKISDSSGINIMGTGIGHDLVAVLDNDPEKTFVLNSFYEADLNDFRKGTVRYPLPQLEEGIHHIAIRAWDVANNSGEAQLEFRIIREEQFALQHVLNYPNPFTTHTSFWFEHNQPGAELTITVQVFTVSGKLVKTLRNTIISTGNRSSEVTWDGRDEYGSRLARGVYIYRISVKTAEGRKAEKWEKLYLL